MTSDGRGGVAKSDFISKEALIKHLIWWRGVKKGGTKESGERQDRQ